MTRLHDLFDVSYGNKFDLNKMRRCSVSRGGVHFVGRSSQNHGVSASVALLRSIVPYEAGLITVALGGTKILSSFVQGTPFYTAQNVAILRPKVQMGFSEKLFLCLCIRHNRFRYSAFGREANRTLGELLVPEPAEFPTWAHGQTEVLEILSAPKLDSSTAPVLNPATWKMFELQEIFEIERGRGPRKKTLTVMEKRRSSHQATPIMA